MPTIRVAVGPAVDAVQRVAPIALGQVVQANYPAPQVQTSPGVWAGAADWATATHAAWDDHRITRDDQALAAAIDADPTRVPQDMTGHTASTIRSLYAVEIAAWEAANP